MTEMALDITQLRAAFAKKSENPNGEANTGFWDKFFPFFRMDFDQVSVFRFLPDADNDNPLGFIVENKYHELIINGKKKRIACLKMYGESCPCCEASRKYYDAGDQVMGKKFWRKIDYIAQGLVINTPLEYPITDTENPVRLISLSNKLYAKIENAIIQGDLDEMPYDMSGGYDFRILKTRQGEYADYSNSDFARKSSPVPANLAPRIELYELAKYRYGKIEREQMDAMIQSFLTGVEYEDGKEGGTASPDVDTPKSTQSVDAVMQAAASAPAASAATPAAAGGAPKLSPQEILAKLKARQPS